MIIIPEEITPTEMQQHSNKLKKPLDNQAAELTAITESSRQKIARHGQVENEPKEHCNQVGSDTNKSEIEMANHSDVSRERASILAIVDGLKGRVETLSALTSILAIVDSLEGQVEILSALKEIWEFEPEAAEKIISEESVARAQLERKTKTLAAQVDQQRHAK